MYAVVQSTAFLVHVLGKASTLTSGKICG